MNTPWASGELLVVPYRPFVGSITKNDEILVAAIRHPERFLVSPRSGDVQALVAQVLTDPNNYTWEVWKNSTLCGILLVDRIVPAVDARVQFVFFDDELASKAPLLNDFVARCFSEFGLHRLTFEAPTHMTTLYSFVRRKLGFTLEGTRVSAYHDDTRWHDVAVLGRVNA